jgi:hypothetical protein
MSVSRMYRNQALQEQDALNEVGPVKTWCLRGLDGH